MAELQRLNWGCGNDTPAGWINSDVKDQPGIDVVADIVEGLPLDDESMDCIVSIHALPMISYPDLVPVLRELRRILKPAGILRLALPDVHKGIEALQRGDRSYFLIPDEDVQSVGGKFVVHMLWYGYSVTLFTADFIEELLYKAGFSDVAHCGYRDSRSGVEGITDLDNRPHESLFVEATK